MRLHPGRSQRVFAALTSALLLSSIPACYSIAPSKGGGQIAKTTQRQTPNPANIALPPGYRITALATGLNFPTAVAFDDAGTAHVVEAGYCYGEVFATPRLLRIDANGATTPIAQGKEKEDGPWTGVTFHNGNFYLADGGEMNGGRILKISPDGKVDTLIDKLPSIGDHHTNGPAIGPDNKLYFAIGTATNSGVVGPDNFEFGWAKRHPDFHDIPARDITLAGQNFTSDDPRSSGGATVSTGAFVAFGTPSQPGQVIKGQLPATGAVMRIPLDATPQNSQLELVAWGLRNPFGLAFASTGELLVTENSYDVRGSRPVWGTGDYLWSIPTNQPPLWYGWPDFHGSEPLTNNDWFQPPRKPELKFVLASHPNPPMEPAAKFPVHAAAGRLDVSRSERFGHTGQAFVALFGDMSPKVGAVIAPVGFMIVRVDPKTGISEPFALNKGKGDGRPYGPASVQDPQFGGGLERPIDARFSPDGSALYVVDFGILTMSEKGPQPIPNTGVLWKITREVQP
jgi:glucose/arabinose dehydrogenase